MPIDIHDTIAAAASAPGPAARGIIRISGAQVVDVLETVFSTGDSVDWASHRTPVRTNGQLNVSSLSVSLPATLMLWPTTRSYTGQPMAELHLVGSPPLMDAVLEALSANGARMAGRGEFTMRAFLAGRIDLVQAEAVLGVIDAADHQELETALTQLGGGITTQLAGVRGELLALLGDLEAGLDFVEEDIEFISQEQIVSRLTVCSGTVDELLKTAATRIPSGHRRRVVLAGLPNAGKSTLFNRLMGSQQAIVSPVAGTTRDYLTGVVKMGAVEVELVDTAGWEPARDLIMRNAQDLRSRQINQCDLVVWCSASDLSKHAKDTDRELLTTVRTSAIPVLEVRTRADLASCAVSELSIGLGADDQLRDLLRVIEQHLAADPADRSRLLATTVARCGESLRQLQQCLLNATRAAKSSEGDEVTAFELRSALQHLGIILGEVYTDDILDHIFSNFCIGK